MYNTKQYINKAKKVHNARYDYSLLEYRYSKDKIKIICPEHGIFEQIASKHLFGYGCSKCGGSNKKTTSEFINESKKIHNNKYDYSLVTYISSRDNVDIICKTHGKFKQRAYNHLNGTGCVKCHIENKIKSNDKFIRQSNDVHNNKYDYSLCVYKKGDEKIDIICPDHGKFAQKPIFHLRGQGCPKCADDNKRLTSAGFILNSKRIHGDVYDYVKIDYINNYTKVEIICPNHGSFYQAPNYHMLGQGCPKCKSSKMEKYIYSFLKNNNILFISQKTFKECKNINVLPFDFFLPDFNVCIECNGEQHYKPIDYFGGEKTLKYIQHNDKLKKKFCKNNNIDYLEIKYNENIDEKIKKKLEI